MARDLPSRRRPPCSLAIRAGEENSNARLMTTYARSGGREQRPYGTSADVGLGQQSTIPD